MPVVKPVTRGIVPFTRENIGRLPNSGGIYHLYDRDGNEIYVGMTAGKKGKQWGPDKNDCFRYGLKHRLQSYYQEDSPVVHPTKPALRKEIHFFDAEVVPSDRMRTIMEKREKKGLPFNHL